MEVQGLGRLSSPCSQHGLCCRWLQSPGLLFITMWRPGTDVLCSCKWGTGGKIPASPAPAACELETWRPSVWVNRNLLLSAESGSALSRSPQVSSSPVQDEGAHLQLQGQCPPPNLDQLHSCSAAAKRFPAPTPGATELGRGSAGCVAALLSFWCMGRLPCLQPPALLGPGSQLTPSLAPHWAPTVQGLGPSCPVPSSLGSFCG